MGCLYTLSTELEVWIFRQQPFLDYFWWKHFTNKVKDLIISNTFFPFFNQVKLAEDVGVPKTSANVLPGYLSLAQSVGKVFIGKVFSYGSVNRILAYQISLVVLSIATTFVPVLKTYPGLIGYAIVFGFSDGCGQATNMIIIGDLTGKKLLPKAYSTFLVCSASAFVVGPPIAGKRICVSISFFEV